MAYTINLTNGTSLIPGGLSPAAVDTSHSSLTLIGKDYSGYGQFLMTILYIYWKILHQLQVLLIHLKDNYGGTLQIIF